jgi:hypothetical protein
MSEFDSATMGQATPEETMSALFANMVVQQTNMALVFLGKVPHPESGQKTADLETARLFIDQLEMLEVKTKGNLNPQEQKLLKQSLAMLHMSFVEVASESEKGGAAPETSEPSPSSAQPESPDSSAAPTSAPDADTRKKFTKKY